MWRLSGNQEKLAMRGAGAGHHMSRRYGAPPATGTIQDCHMSGALTPGMADTPSFVPSGENPRDASIKRSSPTCPCLFATRSTRVEVEVAAPGRVDDQIHALRTTSIHSPWRKKANVRP